MPRPVLTWSWASQVHLDVWLEVGVEYMAVPISFNGKPESTDITFVAVSARRTQVQAVELSVPEYERVVFDYVTASGEASEFHGVTVTTRKDGCALLVHVANRNPDRWAVMEYTITSNTMVITHQCCAPLHSA